MKCLFRKTWEMLRESTRGAALLMVLLVTVFVILTGSSVMFTSYNTYVMKLMEREGAKTFYSTEEIVDLVRVEYQEVASYALQESYTRVMAEYSFIVAQYKEESAIQEEAQNRFNQYFIEELDKFTVSTPSGTQPIFSVYDSTNLSTNLKNGSVTGTYYTGSVGEQLPDGVSYTEEFTSSNFGTAYGTELTGAGGATGTSFTANDGTFNFEYGDNGYPRLVLENLKVSHVSDSGYQTNITTDIVIEMPMFTHTGEINTGSEGNDNREGIPFENVATLGKYWVKVSTQSTDHDILMVKGDVYGGVFFTYNENFTGNYADNSDLIIFSHGEGRLITFNGSILAEDAHDSFHTGTLVERFRTDNLGREIHEGVEVYDGTNFLTSPDSELWTKSVYVDAGSNATLDGITFIEGDITLDGGESRYTNKDFHYTTSTLKLAGDVVMFGNGITAEDSSAIIIDGPDVILDFAELNKLYVAGTSYLTPGRVNNFDMVDDGSDAYNTAYEAYLAANAAAQYNLGQSISALPDQIAYLVPPGAIKNSTYSINSNPIMVENTSASNLFNGTTVDTSFGILGGKVGDYAKSSTHIISRTYGDYILYYFFYEFIDDAAQAKYLKDYVAYNDNFQTNLELFVDATNTSGDYLNGGISTTGSFYYLDSAGDLQIKDPTFLAFGAAGEYQSDFAKMSITLWASLEPTNREIIYLDPNVYDRHASDDNIDGILKRINPYALQEDWEDMQELIDASENHVELRTKYWIRDASPNGYATVNNPFDYYVNIDKLINDCYMQYTELIDDSLTADEKMGEVENKQATSKVHPYHMYFYFDSDVNKEYPVAVFGSNGFNYAETPPGGTIATMYDPYDNFIRYEKLCMLLAFNGINIHKDYTGLAMSNTGIAVLAPITSDPDLINEAIFAKNDFGIPLKDYLRNLNFDQESEGNLETPGTSSNNAEVNWAPNDLVYYENWEKH